MDERPNDNSLTLRAWGTSLRASGSTVVVTVVLLLGFGTLAWILEKGFTSLGNSQHAILEQVTIVQSQHFAQEYAQRDLACVLAMPSEARVAAITDPYGACHFATGYAAERHFEAAEEKPPPPPPRSVPGREIPSKRPSLRSSRDREGLSPPARPSSEPERQRYPTSGFPSAGQP